jgi:hypothetical protein
MNLIFLATNKQIETVDADLIINALSPLIYTAMLVLGFLTIARGLLKGENVKKILMKLTVCGVIAFIGYKPVMLRQLGEAIVGLLGFFIGIFY